MVRAEPPRRAEARAVTGQHVVVRADASMTSGTGHVMRCVALAQELGSRGADVVFACASLTPMARQRLASENLALLELEPDTSIAQLSRHRTPDWVVLDLGTAFDPAMLDGVDRPVLVIDDLGQDFVTSPDLVVNQNLHAFSTGYGGVDARHVLRGPSFLLLRNEFHRRAMDTSAHATGEGVLLSLGGTDPLRLLPPFAEALADECVPVTVVTAAGHPDMSRLRHLAESSDDVCLHEQVVDMAELMSQARMAVTSGGTTVWELAALGVPAIVGSVAPIEDRLLSGLRDRGLFDVLGPYPQVAPGALAARVRDRLADEAWLTETARFARRTVDGQGRRRVVDAMEDRS